MKKLISVIVALALILSLSATVFAADTIKVYCQAPDGWATCNVHWWGSSKGESSWPGDAMTKGADGIWYAEIPADVGGLLFNKAGDDGKTSDLTLPTDGKLMFVIGNNEWAEYGSVVEIVEKYYVAGESALCGDNWNPGAAANIMTKAADGTWTKTYEAVAAGSYQFKVTDGTWSNSWGKDGGSDNYVLTLEETADVTIVFDAANHTVSVKLSTEAGGGEAIVIAEAEGAASAEIPVCLAADGTVTVNVTDFAVSTSYTAGYTVNLLNADAEEYIETGTYYAEAGQVQFSLTGGVHYVVEVYPAEMYNVNLAWTTAGTVSYKITSDVAVVEGEGGNEGGDTAVSTAPESLIVGDNAYSIVENDTAALSSTYTATEAGTVTINPTAMSVMNFGGEWEDVLAAYIPMQFGRSYALMVNGENIFTWPATVEVAAGDEVTVALQSPMGSPVKVTVTVAFTAGESGGSEGGEGGGETGGETGGDTDDNVVRGDGNITVTDVPVGEEKPWTYILTTDTTGILSVVVPNGCRYKIYGLEGPDSESIYFGWFSPSEYPLTYAGEFKVCVWAGDSLGNQDGTISATITFTPDEVEIPKEEYKVSDTKLDLGDNDLSMEENADNTLFEFEPTEPGVYVFTAPAGSQIGNWNTSTYPWDMTADKTNTVEWTCTSVGQSVLIGVVGSEDIVMNVEKKSDAGTGDEIVYEDYINVHIPNEDNMIELGDETPTNVDITKEQDVVLGEDGFYHIGGANGPIVYVNLSNEGFDFIQAFFGGYGAMTMRGKYIEEDGTVKYYDFLTAMRAYATVIYDTDIENSLYPLTKDLAIYLKAYGAYQGWYTPGLSPYEAINGEHEEDSAWLVACCYLGSIEEGGEVETPDEPAKTADIGMGAFVILMVLASTTVAILFVNKKKFF